jgi:hypothetical protein
MAYAGSDEGPFAPLKQEQRRDGGGDRNRLGTPAPAGLALVKIGQSKVGIGVTIKGRWGTFINGKSYQQMPLDTFK